MSTPRPKAQLPEWTKGDTLELVGWFGVVAVVDVAEKPSTITTKVRVQDTGAIMLVSNELLRKKGVTPIQTDRPAP